MQAQVQAISPATRRNARVRRMFLRVFTHLMLLAAGFLTIFPLIAMFGIALKPFGVPLEIMAMLPREFTLDNIVKVWTEAPIGVMLKNSTIITVVTTIFVLFLGSLAAYGFSRWNFLGSKVVLLTFLLGLMIPGVALIVPLFRIVRIMGLFNTYPALILPLTALSLPFTILILRAYFDTLPYEIEEAAIMDGASSFMIYYRIVLPMSMPALSAVAIFLVLGTWNEFLLAMLFMTKTDMRTAPLAWIYFTYFFGVEQQEQLFAALAWIVVPPLVFYFIMQRHFVSGLTAGALKG